MPFGGVVERGPGGQIRELNPFTRLLQDRIIFVGEPISNEVASWMIAQLLFLEQDNPEKDINIYFNSPGGSVTAGMAIYDTMQYIRPQVSTVCIGMAASMAAVLTAAGAKGKRFATPNARLMIHQPMGALGGQASDMEIHAREIIRTKEKLIEILAHHSGQDIDKLRTDQERDFFLTAQEAVKYGLIDEVVENRGKAEDAEPTKKAS